MKDEEKNKVEEPIETVINESLPADDSEVIEFEYNDDGEEDLKKTLKKFRADLKTCQKEKEEYLTGWQKERADFINYKKAEDDRKANFSEAMRERILMRFLNVLDSFDMAFANSEAWQKVDENWRKGVEYIHAQMNGIFEEFGVKPIGEIGESFDPSIHQSIDMITTNKKEQDHTIAEVTQKGYKMGDPSTGSGQGRVIRPARVNVYEYNEIIK